MTISLRSADRWAARGWHRTNMSMMESLQPIGPLAELAAEEERLRAYLATLEQSSALNDPGGIMPPAANPRPSAMERIGMSLAQSPPYIPGRSDTTGQRIAGGLLSGFARGFGQQTNLAVAQRNREADREREQAAASNRARIAASAAHRAEIAKQAGSLAEMRWKKMLDPDETPEQRRLRIKSDAQAAAEGGAAGRGEAGEEPLLLTPEGLDVAALNYARTGQLPPMGIGKAGMGIRAKIINRAAFLNPNLDVAGNRAAFAADRTSLTGLQRQFDAYKSYERTVTLNTDVLRKAMSKIKDTGSPVLNTVVRNIDKNALGSEELAAYNAALQTVVPEFARLLNNPNLTGQLTDTARKEIDSIVSKNYTINQMLAALAVLEQDANNRVTSSQDQINEVKARLGQSPYPERPSSAGAGGATIRMAGPDGVPRLVPASRKAEAEANGMKVIP